MLVGSLKAQDLVITNRGDSIKCIITEITPKQIYFTYKEGSEIRNSIRPIGLIKKYEKAFYGVDSAFIKSVTPVTVNSVPAISIAAVDNPRVVNTNYYDLIVTQKGDSLNCKIINILDNGIEYGFSVNGNYMKATLPTEEIKSYKFGYFTKKLVPKYSKSRFSFDIGLGYRTAPSPANIPNSYKEHLNKLRSGLSLGADFTGFLSPLFGLGVRFNYYSSSQQSDRVSINNGTFYTGSISEKVKIMYIAPSLSFRTIDAASQSSFIFSVGAGYMSYKDEFTFSQQSLISGKTAGLNLTLGFDSPIGQTKKNSLKFQLSLLSGRLNEINVESGNANQKIKLEGDDIEGLGRLDLTVGFSFYD